MRSRVVRNENNFVKKCLSRSVGFHDDDVWSWSSPFTRQWLCAEEEDDEEYQRQRRVSLFRWMAMFVEWTKYVFTWKSPSTRIVNKTVSGGKRAEDETQTHELECAYSLFSCIIQFGAFRSGDVRRQREEIRSNVLFCLYLFMIICSCLCVPLKINTLSFEHVLLLCDGRCRSPTNRAQRHSMEMWNAKYYCSMPTTRTQFCPFSNEWVESGF